MTTILKTAPRRKWTRAEKESLAREWRSSGLTQAQFCAQGHVGISVRALRYWVRNHATPPPTAASVTATVKKAVVALRDAADALESSLVVPPSAPTQADEARRSVADDVASPGVSAASSRTAAKFTFD